jgi:hypothetical protein
LELSGLWAGGAASFVIQSERGVINSVVCLRQSHFGFRAATTVFLMVDDEILLPVVKIFDAC